MITEYISWMCTIDLFIQEMDLLNVSIIEVRIPKAKEWPFFKLFHLLISFLATMLSFLHFT